MQLGLDLSTQNLSKNKSETYQKKRGISFKKISNNLLKEKHPSMNFIKKDDVSSLAYYLTTNQASQITGSNLIIDGGWTAQ